MKREQFDFEEDNFKKTGRLQVFFAGSERSFFELGKYFIAVSKFPAENPNYHDHLDGLMPVVNKKPVEIIVSVAQEGLSHGDFLLQGVRRLGEAR